MSTFTDYRCPSDGSRVFSVGENLYKCVLCDRYFREKDGNLVPYALRVYPYGGDVRERLEVVGLGAPSKEEETTEPSAPFGDELDGDMVIFIRRVAEALTPVKGYERDESFKRRAFRVREQFIGELTDCLTGKRDFNKWFDATKTSLGKHPSEMTQIMYNALEGLKSPEAMQMQNAFGAAMKRSPY